MSASDGKTWSARIDNGEVVVARTMSDGKAIWKETQERSSRGQEIELYKWAVAEFMGGPLTTTPYAILPIQNDFS
jgi:hypothetical protein